MARDRWRERNWDDPKGQWEYFGHQHQYDWAVGRERVVRCVRRWPLYFGTPRIFEERSAKWAGDIGRGEPIIEFRQT